MLEGRGAFVDRSEVVELVLELVPLHSKMNINIYLYVRLNEKKNSPRIIIGAGGGGVGGCNQRTIMFCL